MFWKKPAAPAPEPEPESAPMDGELAIEGFLVVAITRYDSWDYSDVSLIVDGKLQFLRIACSAVKHQNLINRLRKKFAINPSL